MRQDTDIVVVGAGVVGLAAAAALARAGRSVLVIERHGRIAQETTSRNSEVIHAGLHYPEGSLKARLCVAGREALYRFCRKHDIQLEAYSPLTKGHKLNDPKLVTLASKYSKNPAQILIRWALQHEIVVIPKSSRKERITENAAVFDFTISPEDMRALDLFNQGLRTSWDPTTAP